MAAKDKSEGKADSFEAAAFEDAEHVTEEGSHGPGRGTPLRELPKHSVYTLLAGPLDAKGKPIPAKSQAEAEARRRGYEKLKHIALWAISSVRVPGCEDDAMQAVMFAFTRHAIPPNTKMRDVLKAACTTAKRWTIEEKRLVGFPVILDRKDFFDKAARDSCLRTDADIGLDEDAADELRHIDFVDTLDGVEETDLIDWTNIPPHMRTAINKAWRQVDVRVTKVMRHVLMGEPLSRAAELEAVAYQTAVSHSRTFMKFAQANL